MKLSHLPALPLLAMLLWAAPAAATGGYACATSGKDAIELNIIIGHAVAPVIAQVTLIDGETTLSTVQEVGRIAILQSWIDPKELRLDLTDPNVERYEARLRLRFSGGSNASGTIERNGRTMRIRCSGEQ